MYVYQSFEQDAQDEWHPTDCDSDFESVCKPERVGPRKKIDVYKHDRLHVVLRSVEDIESFRRGLEIAAAWKPEPLEMRSIKTESNPSGLRDFVDRNLKTAAAVGKLPSAVVPPIADFALGLAMKDGADKYGPFNWRGTEVTASVFFEALKRHLLFWASGEDFAKDSKVHHLAHLMAGCAILLDAELVGVFRDDRHKIDLSDLPEAFFKVLKCPAA